MAVVIHVEGIMRKTLIGFILTILVFVIALPEQRREDITEGDVVNLKKMYTKEWDSVLIVNTPYVADEETRSYVFDAMDKYMRGSWGEHATTSVMIFYKEGDIQEVTGYNYRNGFAPVYCTSFSINSLPTETFIAYPSDTFTIHVQDDYNYAVLNQRDEAQ